MTTENAPPGGAPALGAVVIGGSAGSLESLLAIVERLPGDFPAPVVVVLHTPRDPPSGLVEALSPRSALPVREPEDKDPLVPGAVFVAAPGYHLLVERGPSFAYSVDAPERFSQPSIDVLFESAADVFGEALTGVVLSGANDDGARGVAAIHRAGGRALVQAPEEAAWPEMPRAALAACPEAEALPARRIAEKLADSIRSAAFATRSE